MKINIALLFVLFWTSLVSGCGVTAAQPGDASPMITATANVDTLSPMPTATIVNTPLPTQTLVPVTPTPSRMEYPVENASLGIEIIDVERPYQVYLGDKSIFSPGEGNMFLGLGIKVTNLTDQDIPFKWTEIYLINKYQDKWYPLWGAYEKTNMVIDPLGIEIRQFKVDHKNRPEARVFLGDNGYLRAIFRLPRDNYYYYLGFADLPLIEIPYGDF